MEKRHSIDLWVNGSNFVINIFCKFQNGISEMPKKIISLPMLNRIKIKWSRVKDTAEKYKCWWEKEKNHYEKKFKEAKIWERRGKMRKNEKFIPKILMFSFLLTLLSGFDCCITRQGYCPIGFPCQTLPITTTTKRGLRNIN